MAQVGSDRRRINGPEESHLPVSERDDNSDNLRWKLGDLRKGRGPTDIRPIFLQPTLIDQANGSAYLEAEQTKIACAVYGPRQLKNTSYNEKGKLNVEVKFAPFSCERRRAPMRDADDRSIAMAIHQALTPSIRLELLPKSTIDLFITVIEADGIEGCVASGIVAATTALADARIEMIGLVVSCAVCIVGSETWLDPTAEEAQASKGSLVLACIPALGTITSVWQSGLMKVEELFGCIDTCQGRCIDIHAVVAQVLLDNVAAK